MTGMTISTGWLNFIATLKTVERVEVLPYHTLGTFKGENLLLIIR